MILIVDSFAWIEFLGGTSLEPAIRAQPSEADVVVTPDLVLAEVARKLARDGVARPVALRKLSGISNLLPRGGSCLRHARGDSPRPFLRRGHRVPLACC